MPTLAAIRLAAAEKSFQRHVSARAWQRHCAAGGFPRHGAAVAANATARYDAIRACLKRRDGLTIVAGRPLEGTEARVTETAQEREWREGNDEAGPFNLVAAYGATP